jgi:hypothetical protein
LDTINWTSLRTSTIIYVHDYLHDKVVSNNNAHFDFQVNLKILKKELTDMIKNELTVFATYKQILDINIKKLCKNQIAKIQRIFDTISAIGEECLTFMKEKFQLFYSGDRKLLNDNAEKIKQIQNKQIKNHKYSSVEQEKLNNILKLVLQKFEKEEEHSAEYITKMFTRSSSTLINSTTTDFDDNYVQKSPIVSQNKKRKQKFNDKAIVLKSKKIKRNTKRSAIKNKSTNAYKKNDDHDIDNHENYESYDDEYENDDDVDEKRKNMNNDEHEKNDDEYDKSDVNDSDHDDHENDNVDEKNVNVNKNYNESDDSKNDDKNDDSEHEEDIDNVDNVENDNVDEKFNNDETDESDDENDNAYEDIDSHEHVTVKNGDDKNGDVNIDENFGDKNNNNNNGDEKNVINDINVADKTDHEKNKIDKTDQALDLTGDDDVDDEVLKQFDNKIDKMFDDFKCVIKKKIRNNYIESKTMEEILLYPNLIDYYFQLYLLSHNFFLFNCFCETNYKTKIKKSFNLQL